VKFFSTGLGRDFWLFRAGQLVSVMGDAFADMALAWWILDKTGSALKISAVLGPAIFVRVGLLPFMGPLGDMFDRKKLVLICDAARAFLFAALAIMAFSAHFSLPVIMAIYIAEAFFSALFDATAISIIPQLVPAARLRQAMQSTHALVSTGRIAGSLLGGVFITLLGVPLAFIFNAFSFAGAAVATAFLKADTAPEQTVSREVCLGGIISSMKEGAIVLFRVRVLFWMAVISMLANIVMVPLNSLVFPVLVKDAMLCKPWLLGVMNAAMSVGSIYGAISLGTVDKITSPARIMLAANFLAGVSLAMFYFNGSAAVPVVMSFLIGASVTVSNVIYGTQISWVVPNEYRARINSLIKFFAGAAVPVGMWLAGWGVSELGAGPFLLILGILIAVLTPAMTRIPDFVEFFSLTSGGAPDFFKKRHAPTV
jgi:DHA3 family macrolide efflux protein-like MFS transporter